ncbi:MAG: energy-coupling factor ABC transporter permease [Neisseria sp.]|nr:energy-coupling factor ABC transporter permease [Neisseria sp.]
MDLFADRFNPIYLYFTHAVWLVLFAFALPKAWRNIKQHPHIVGIICCLFAVLWSLRASLGDGQMAGLSYHLLGMVLASLMLGVRSVFVVASVFFLPYFWLLNPLHNLHAISINALFLFVPSLSVAFMMQKLCRRLPKNLFIYIFINGFFAAAFSMFITGIALISLQTALPYFDAVPLWQNAFPVFILLAWAEAFLTGLFTAIFVALKPQFLLTFNDQSYLKRQNSIWLDKE